MPVFSDAIYSHEDFKFTNNAAIKIGLIIPFWLANPWNDEVCLRIAGEHLVLEKVVFRGIDGRNEPAEIIKVMEKPRRSLHGFSPGRI
ncbi:MAG TPA: hypothetical protein VJ350_06325 [Methanoregula sp.]|nr:hypothetical protein [Methanoregula sp.]